MPLSVPLAVTPGCPFGGPRRGRRLAHGGWPASPLPQPARLGTMAYRRTAKGARSPSPCRPSMVRLVQKRHQRTEVFGVGFERAYKAGSSKRPAGADVVLSRDGDMRDGREPSRDGMPGTDASGAARFYDQVKQPLPPGLRPRSPAGGHQRRGAAQPDPELRARLSRSRRQDTSSEQRSASTAEHGLGADPSGHDDRADPRDPS